MCISFIFSFVHRKKKPWPFSALHWGLRLHQAKHKIRPDKKEQQGQAALTEWWTQQEPGTSSFLQQSCCSAKPLLWNMLPPTSKPQQDPDPLPSHRQDPAGVTGCCSGDEALEWPPNTQHQRAHGCPIYRNCFSANKQKILSLKLLWFKKLQSGKTIDDCLFLTCSSERMKDHLFSVSSCYL